MSRNIPKTIIHELNRSSRSRYVAEVPAGATAVIDGGSICVLATKSMSRSCPATSADWAANPTIGLLNFNRVQGLGRRANDQHRPPPLTFYTSFVTSSITCGWDSDGFG